MFWACLSPFPVCFKKKVSFLYQSEGKLFSLTCQWSLALKAFHILTHFHDGDKDPQIQSHPSGQTQITE